MASLDSIGRYQIDERVASGSFATVWRAHDAALDTNVAIKVLAENWAASDDMRSRFVEEARMLRRADSDRVVRVYDIGELDDGRPYFVMTYADRGTLFDRLAGGRLPAAVALQYASQAGHGLAALHELGILHRDLKPSNILFASSGSGERLLIADLGLAKSLLNNTGLTVTGGTPGYMAPEQARVGGRVDERTDIYGLGAVAYHMLTGDAPASVLTGDAAAPLRQLDPHLAEAVEAIVMRALDHDPARRWPDVRSFTTAIDQLPAAATAAASAPVPQETVVGSDPSAAPETMAPGATAGAPGLQPPAPGSPVPPETMAAPGPPGAAAQPPAPGTPPPPATQHAPTMAGAPPYGHAPPHPPSDHPGQPGHGGQGGQPAAGASGRQPGNSCGPSLKAVLLSMVGGFLVLVLLAAGGFGFWQYRLTTPQEVASKNGAITVEIRPDWHSDERLPEPAEQETMLSDYGADFERGLIMSTMASHLDATNEDRGFESYDVAGRGVAVVAGTGLRTVDAEELLGSYPEDMWNFDNTFCEKGETRELQPAGLTEALVQSYDCPPEKARNDYMHAVVYTKKAAAHVFVHTPPEASMEQFDELVGSIRLNASKLP